MIRPGLSSLIAVAMTLTASSLSGAFIFEAESDGTAANNSVATAQRIAAPAFTLPTPATVFDAPTYTTATVNGSGGFADVDFFSFFAYGGHVLLDMDNTNPGFDPLVALFDGMGTLLAYGDDSELDNGSVNTIDSFVGSFMLPGAGTYYVAVSESPNFPTTALTGTETALTRPDGGFGGYAVSGVASGVSSFDFDGTQPGGALYTLHISAQSAVPEPASLAMMGGGLMAIAAVARSRRRRR